MKNGNWLGTLCNCEPASWNTGFTSQRACVEDFLNAGECVLDTAAGESLSQFSLAATNEEETGSSTTVPLIAAIGGMLLGALGLFAAQKVSKGQRPPTDDGEKEMDAATSGRSGQAGTTSRTRAPYMETADI